MDLTKRDRLILSNQFRILQLLDPENTDEYEKSITIVEKGFRFNYDRLVEHFYDELPEEVSEEVYAILELYRAIHDAYGGLTEDEKPQIPKHKLEFRGFDGNYEVHHRSYCLFLLKDNNLYRELQNGSDYNTHQPSVERYRRMLHMWKSLGKKRELDLTEIKQLLNI